MKSPYNGLELMFFVRRFLLCHDDSVISRKEIRELTILLLLSEFGVITKEQLQLIIFYTADYLRNYSKNTLTSIASRLCRLESLKEIEKDRETYITFSKSGPERMVNLLHKLFTYLNLKFNEYTDAEYLLNRATRTFNTYSVKPHSIFINTSIIFAIFSTGAKYTAYYLQKERKIPSPFSTRNIQGKSEDDIYPDFLFIPSRKERSAGAIEVDLGTEDICSNKSSSVLSKIESYTSSYNHYQTDVFFLFEAKDISYISEETKVLRQGYKTISTMISHRSYAREIPYLRFIVSIAQNINTLAEQPPLSSINDLLILMQLHYSSCDSDFVSIKDTFLFKLIRLVAKYVDYNGIIVDTELDPKDQGQLPICELLPLLEHVKTTMGSRQTVLFAAENSNRLCLKRRHIYKAFMNSNLNVINLGKPVYGVMSGMILSLSSNSRLWKKMSYIYFSDTVKTNLGNIISNLGIINHPEKVTNFKLTRPLIVDCPPNNYRNRLSLLSMRNTFRIGNIDICIENISEDMGGLYRVQSYLKLPFGTRPNTLVIALVDESDYVLANGEKLQSGSLFYLPNNNRHKDTPICSGEYAYWPYIKSRITKFVGDNHLPESNNYLPLSLDKTQELIFLSYHDWDMAINSRVTPWIYDHEDDRLIHRKYKSPNHILEPHLLSKYRNSYYIYDWQ